MKPETHSSDQASGVRQRCMAYLLGEMSPAEASRFESELNQPEIAEALAVESELIFRLADCDLLDQSSGRQSPPALPCPDSSSSPLPAFSVRRITALIASLAATFLIVAVSLNSNLNPVDESTTAMNLATSPALVSFELELAKTWVQPAIEWPAETRDTLVETDDCIPLISLEEADASGEAGAEETFGWMVAAVEASIREGDRNDG